MHAIVIYMRSYMGTYGENMCRTYVCANVVAVGASLVASAFEVLWPMAQSKWLSMQSVASVYDVAKGCGD